MERDVSTRTRGRPKKAAPNKADPDSEEYHGNFAPSRCWGRSPTQAEKTFRPGDSP